MRSYGYNRSLQQPLYTITKYQLPAISCFVHCIHHTYIPIAGEEQLNLYMVETCVILESWDQQEVSELHQGVPIFWVTSGDPHFMFLHYRGVMRYLISRGIHKWTLLDMQTHTHIYTYTHVHTYTQVHTHTYTHVHIWTQNFVHTCTIHDTCVNL